MITVRELVERLDGAIVHVVAPPAGVEALVARVVLPDPNDMPEIGPGDLVVGIGVLAGSSADRLLSLVAAAGGAGLVTRERVARMLAPEAERLSVTLLGVPEGAAWIHVIRVISSLTSRASFGASDARLLAAGSGDLFSIANVVAELIDAPVTIEDLRSRVIAFSSRQEDTDDMRRLTILGRRVPDGYQRALRARGIFQLLARESAPIYVEGVAEGVRPRVAVALRAGDELLGSIWAVVSEPLSEERAASLAEAAHFVALHLLRHNLIDDGSRVESELLQTALQGGAPAAEAAVRLGLPGPSFAVVAAVPGVDEDSMGSLLPQLRDLLSMHLSRDRRVPATIIDSTAYSVVSVAATVEQVGSSLRGRLSRLAERSGRILRAGVMIGIGPVVHSASELQASRAHAEQIVRVLRSERRTGVADVDDVAAKVLLLRVSDSLGNDPDLLSRPLRTLQQYDFDNHAGYLPTLAAYLRAFGAVDVAAQELRVHGNTVRYRLRQIQTLTGLDLSDPDERLALTLQLRLLAQRGAFEPAQLPGGIPSGTMDGSPRRRMSSAY